jgi:hypothetical protein
MTRKNRKPLSNYIRILDEQNYFQIPRSSSELVKEVRREFGQSYRTNYVQTYMQPFLGTHLYSIEHPRSKMVYWVSKKTPKPKALQLVAGSSTTASERLFSTELKRRMGKRFEADFKDLEHAYGNSGTCTAFMLRKILEKAVYLVFAKNQQAHLIQDSKTKYFFGLQEILNLSAQTKFDGLPVLLPKTVDKLSGIKFLGDTSAHNPLVNVPMESITPQLPFLVVAYEELAKRL